MSEVDGDAPDSQPNEATETKGSKKSKKPREPWDRPLLRVAASALCGVFMFMGSPDTNMWWLGFIAWVPWMWSFEGLNPKRAFLVGWVAGFVAVFVGHFWMTELLTRFAGLPDAISIPILALFALFHGLLWGVPAALLTWLRRRTGRRSVWAAPMAWSATELMLPNIFPTFMALMWCWQPLWIQTAELGGVSTVSFTMLAMNSGIYEAIRAWKAADRPALKRAVAMAAGFILGVPIYGAIRIAQVEALADEVPHLKIGAVQGNFGIVTYTRGRMKRDILREMQRVSGELQAQGADLVAWGETAYPYQSFDRESFEDLPQNNPRKVRRGFDIPIIFGAITNDSTGQNPYAWNTAFAMNGEGTITGRYDKNYPLVFGEYVPIVDPEWFLDLIPTASHLNRGDGPGVLEVAGQPIGTMICFEDILPHFARETANAGASVFVNLTNDSWFGRSWEQGEHLGLAVYRSVEHRRGLVRVVNAGISAYVDPTGRVVQQTGVTDSDVEGYKGAEGFVADVPMTPPDYKTPFGWFGQGLLLICLGGLFQISRRRD